MDVSIDMKRSIVTALFIATGGKKAPVTGGILTDFLRIGRRASDQAQATAVALFVKRHGLLESPFQLVKRRMRAAGDYFIYVEELSDYIRLSRILGSVLRLHDRLSRSSTFATPESADDDVVAVRKFIQCDGDVARAVRRAQITGTKTGLSTRIHEPLPMARRVGTGDLRAAWRTLQVQRVLDVFGIWVQRGDVRPVVTWDGSEFRGDEWTGGVWGALAGALYESLTGRTRLGVCSFCGTPFEGYQKKPRESYGGKRVRLCCGDVECVRAKRRDDTAKSRARNNPRESTRR